MNNSIFTPDIRYTSTAYMESHLFEAEHCAVFSRLSKICDLTFEMDRSKNSFDIQILGDNYARVKMIREFIKILREDLAPNGSLLYWNNQGTGFSEQRLKVKGSERFPHDCIPAPVFGDKAAVNLSAVVAVLME